ncbi:MAG: hypothetical protein JXR96_08660 [Deltaproteobacteria bacterium]|nr:hypothetical protein [Deltaproteobacteria bacterium]
MEDERQKRRRADDTRNVIMAIGRGATSTVVLQGKILKKIWAHTLGALVSRFWHATLVGKLFALVGLGGCIATGVLASRDAIDISVAHHEFILVTGSHARIHDSTSRKAEVIAKVKRGDELSQQGESKDWWFVTAEGWKKPGWISKHLARPEERVVLKLDYEMKGYGIAFAVSFVLLYLGLCLRKPRSA